jgi:propanol-preferring alcohol dehydrogenase
LRERLEALTHTARRATRTPLSIVAQEAQTGYMEAWIVEEPRSIEENPLVRTERERPLAGAGEVVVRVHACGICRTDLHVVEGDLPVRRQHVVPGHQVVGRVVARGPDVRALALGDRVGIAWLHQTCGVCRFCRRGDENLCLTPEFTGWTRDGGYAEYVRGRADFCYQLPSKFGDLEAAPLLCAGIIGYRCLRQTGLSPASFAGLRLGIYGFGAAGHVAIQIARARGADVYVCTRDRERHQSLAAELGATWVGDTMEAPPVPLDASIIFAPAGELVPAALGHLDRGGKLVLGGIHMSPIPSFPYDQLYQERSVQSVANNTRRDALEFLEEAARVHVETHIEAFPLGEANHALQRLKGDAVRGAAVLVIDGASSA